MKDIAIIGAGIGGLVAGNLLAQKGHKVTLFEAHKMPGGYTAGFHRKGCYFESGTICFENAASIFKAMKDIGVLEKLDFVRQGMRIVSEDFDGIPRDYNEFKEILYGAFPSEREKLDRAFSEMDQIVSAMTGIPDMPLPSLVSAMQMLKAMLPHLPGMLKMMRITRRYGKVTSSEFAARYFEKGTKLYDLFSWFTYPDCSAVLIGGAMSGLFTDTWTVKSGMQSWADVLADNFKQLGGDLKLNSHVDRIITGNGAAVGVSCLDSVYKADYVISAADYKKTFLELLDDKSLVPRALMAKIEDAAVSDCFFAVYLVLDLPNEELEEMLKEHHVFSIDFKPGYDFYDPDDAEYFNKTAYYLFSPSMLNPELAREGKSSLMIQSRTPFRWMNNWGGGDQETYKRLKERVMNTLIDRVSELIPGLSERIDHKEAATPLTYERYTRNSGGASSAWSWNPKKAFFKNSLSVNVKTPVKNLYIGSCWAMQIGGVPGAVAAAYKCVKEIG